VAVVSSLAVSLDRPLLSPAEYTYRTFSTAATSASASWWWRNSSFLAVLLSDMFKTAAVAFVLAAGVSLLPRLRTLRNDGGGGGGGGTDGVGDLAARASSHVRALASRVADAIVGLGGRRGPSSRSSSASSSPSSSGAAGGSPRSAVPMPFDGDGGWGKCSLRSRTAVGGSASGSGSGSAYAIYEFDLPRPDYALPLGLGQQLEFCCLSASDEICTGSFYPYDGGAGKEKGKGRGERGEREVKKRGGGGGRGGSSSRTTTTGVVRVVLPYEKVDDEGNIKFVSFCLPLCFFFFCTPRHRRPSSVVGVGVVLGSFCLLFCYCSSPTRGLC
jgi:hypothetical protein